MKRLRHSQLEAVRHCVEKLSSLHDAATFPQEMLALLTSIIPSEPGYNEFTDDGITLSIRKHPLPLPVIEYLRQLGPKFFNVHPIVNHALNTGSGEPLRLTDCISSSEWRRSSLYNECFRAVGCDYQMGFVWRAGPLRFGLPMNRSKRDFSDSDKQVLSLLRPHLIQAHANVQAFARLSQAIETLQGTVILASRRGRIQYATPKALSWLIEYFGPRLDGTVLPQSLATWLKGSTGLVPPLPFLQTKNENRLAIRAVPSSAEPITLLLEERRARSPADLRILGVTRREAEVLFWLSKAKTNHEIGVILGAATYTIRNHVEHVLKKLKVENRLAAATIALEILSGKRSW